MNNKMISRRTFIGGAAIAGTALTTSGLGTANAYPVKIPNKWDHKVDVVIVGTGVAGLQAAIAAHESKAKTLIVEKMSSPYFSSSSMCAGVAKVSPDTKVAQGKYHGDMYKELMEFGEEASIPDILRAYVDNSAGVMDKLVEKDGLKPIGVAKLAAGFNVAFGNGMNIVKPLVKVVEAEKIPFLFETRATRLITDTSGKVLGIEAKSKKGKINIKADRGVVLATGGFAADMELFDRELVTAKGSYWGVSPTHTGDGFRMASRIGADTTHMPFAGTYDAGFPVSEKPGERRALLLLLMSGPGAIYVNKNGDRFVDETIGNVPVGRAELRQPEKRMIIIMDQTVFDGWIEVNKQIPIVTGWSDERVREEAERGFYIKKANTIKEVAEKAGLPAGKLENTINKYNSYVDTKKDLDFGRKDLKYKIEKAPFYAMPVKPIIMQVLGGLRIDPKARVLDAYDKPIQGLYAAGEVVGGIMGTMYDGGSCIGSGLTFGRIAGKSAAAKV